MNLKITFLMAAFSINCYAEYVANPMMGMDSTSLSGLYNMNVIPSINSSTTTKVLPPPVKVLLLNQGYVDSVCLSGDPVNPWNYNWAQWSSICGSRSCKALGYTYGFISESIGTNQLHPVGSNNSTIQLNCN